MCGICGIFAFHERWAPSPLLLQEMTGLLRHRGPDDEGIFLEGPIGLGHRRLAVIDLSPSGHQPMSSPDETIWITYNGEIYNYRELREYLSQRGRFFRSRSDTEVILHAYLEYGPDCMSHFNGMFAFALWDGRQKALLLARDRLGVKPLYYAQEEGRILFASEIKAILAARDENPHPNPQPIYDFLTQGALDHTNETFFSGVHKLPPAHYMWINSEGRGHMARYWDFEVNEEVISISEGEVEKRSSAFFDLLSDAVHLRLLSDVPVGSCLSGGLDSSTIVSLTGRLIDEENRGVIGSRLQTFSACYEQAKFDERPYIDQVIQWTGAISHRIFPQAEGFIQELPRLIWHQEEPFGTSSIYAQWEVMKAAQQEGIIVLLDGQGADEQLLGYRKFYAFYLRALLQRGRTLLALREMIQHFGSGEVLRTLGWRHGLRYLKGGHIGSTGTSMALLTESFAASFRGKTLDIGMGDGLGSRIKADITRFSLPVLLRYEDKNSMAFSREARVPFLDYRLVEYLAGLPLNLKLRNGWTKYCLRRGARGVVPEGILRRKDKLGFATPEEAWLQGPLRKEVALTFDQASFLPEWVKMAGLRREFSAYLRGRRPLLSSEFFFRFFILEQWARRFNMRP